MASLRSWCWDKLVVYNRLATSLCFPTIFTIQTLIYRPATKENALWFRRTIIAAWVACSGAFYTASFTNRLFSEQSSVLWRFIIHYAWFYAVDWSFGVCVYSATCLQIIFGRESENRLLGTKKKPQFHGKRIAVLGNGPSLIKGTPCGNFIDGMDEVVRFNNFQTKTTGLEKWTGAKCTMHFSDSMLYPSFPEYKVPGATVGLSLFMDRLMVAGSYLIFRSGIDLAFKETMDMMLDPGLGYVSEEDINNLKKTLGISHWKHPTSGCLAIDWFVRNRPDPSVPVYIHGFDFFEGPEIHYYNKTEPLYERINDMIGVKAMHQPEKEKAFVARLVKEGKVKWIKDCVEAEPASKAKDNGKA